MGLIIYLNGEFVDEKDAKVSVFDHGLLYGDGVFEGIRLYNGCIFRLEQHLERLQESAHYLMLNIPCDRNSLREAVAETCRRNNLQNGYIRLLLTRGVGTLGLSPAKCEKSQLIIIAAKIELYPPEFYKTGLNIASVSTRRNIPDVVNPRIKSLNYLNNILAKIEAQNAGCLEAIMLNPQGYVAECTGDNIFIIKNGVIFTPPTYIGALKGITRDCIIELAQKKHMEVNETPFTLFEVYNADECFLTGTAAEAIPVVNVDGRVIGKGKPGPITLQLIDLFHKQVSSDGYLIYKKSQPASARSKKGKK